MTYSQLVSIFRSTANTVLGEGVGLFHYGRTPQHQEKYGEAMPQIHLDPLKDSPNYGTGMTRVSVTLGFLDQDTNQSDSQEQEVIVNRMQVLSDRFMSLLGEQDHFDELTAQRAPVYRYSAAMLTGVSLTFILNVPTEVCY